MNCPKCGKPIPEGKLFCGHCGTKLESEILAEKKERKTAKKSGGVKPIEKNQSTRENFNQGYEINKDNKISKIATVPIWVVVVLSVFGIFCFFFAPLLGILLIIAGFVLLFIKITNKGQKGYEINEGNIISNIATVPIWVSVFLFVFGFFWWFFIGFLHDFSLLLIIAGFVMLLIKLTLKDQI